MCHYCHVLGHNPQAPSHRSINCIDKGNTFSQAQTKRKIYDHGKRIDNHGKRTDGHEKRTDDHGKRTDESSTCAVCLDGTPNMALIPCGHVATCESCGSLVVTCPICRREITGRQKLFFS